MANTEVKHDYHLVDPSPWPIVGSIAAFMMLVGAVFWMNKDYAAFGVVAGQPWIFIVGFAGVLFTMAGWWRDVIQESVVKHNHTPVVKLHLRYGMLLFIASEVMFFVAWFWAYFNSAIFFNDVSIGAWPPNGIVTLDPWHFPLLNTLILLTSGTTVTWAHHAIQHGDRKGAVQGLIITVLLGASFTCVQAYEYAHAPFTFGFNHLALVPFTDPAHVSLTAGVGNFDAIYGSTFFMGDGLPRRPCPHRHDLPDRLPVPRHRGPVHADAPFRLRGGGLVLALRRRGVALPVRLHLCVGPGSGSSRADMTTGPSTAAAALGGRCPRCGVGPLFKGYLDIAPKCTHCGLDYSQFDVGDGATVLRHPDRRRADLRRRPDRRGQMVAALLGPCRALAAGHRDRGLRRPAPRQGATDGPAIQASGARR